METDGNKPRIKVEYDESAKKAIFSNTFRFVSEDGSLKIEFGQLNKISHRNEEFEITVVSNVIIPNSNIEKFLLGVAVSANQMVKDGLLTLKSTRLEAEAKTEPRE